MSPLWFAFLVGIVSALSLPLGAITAIFWKPGGRTIAFLMSFGGGALLAALTIDLAGPALERGHFYPLAYGCIIGGLLFVLLNQIVNRHGGFLRKASTMIFYLNGLQRRRNQRIVTRMRRLDVLNQLSTTDLRDLADNASCRALKDGEAIFCEGDPSRYFCVVEEGEVELRYGGRQADSEILRTNDAFGHKAFFTGSCHRAKAVARRESLVLMIPREVLVHLLRRSHDLRRATASYLQSDELKDYLKIDQHVEPKRVERWAREAASNVLNDGQLPYPSEEQSETNFGEIVDDVRRIPFFRHLPDMEVREIAARVFASHVDEGHTFFLRNEMADRMYIVDEGKVALVDASQERRMTSLVEEHEAFGMMSFLTGTRHASAAVSASPMSAWVLTRIDFDELLDRCPHLNQAVRQFLKEEDVASYLQTKHRFNSSEAASWIDRAVRSMNLGRLIPSAGELRAELGAQHGAPVAIWLGILLDGIPESLVIGSSLLRSNVSLSLIAGLFLSNYPEALSSSIGMREQGFKWRRVLLMWTSLMVITGIGALLGNMFFREAPEALFSHVEGIAAGAMLTMIAETMLPEAYFKGGGIVGFSTLLGFLAAIFFKTLG